MAHRDEDGCGQQRFMQNVAAALPGLAGAGVRALSLARVPSCLATTGADGPCKPLQSPRKITPQRPR